MGFADFLSSGLTAATGASAANQQGIANANKINQDNALTTFQLMRQQKEDEDRKTMMGAQMGQMGANTDYLRAHTLSLTNPRPQAPPQTVNPGQGVLGPDGTYKVPIELADKNPIVGSKEWMDAERFKASLIPTPQRNIDKYSTAGIAAEIAIANGKPRTPNMWSMFGTPGGTPGVIAPPANGAPKAPAKPQGLTPNAQKAAGLVRSGSAKMADIDGSRSLTPQEKAAIHQYLAPVSQVPPQEE